MANRRNKNALRMPMKSQRRKEPKVHSSIPVNNGPTPEEGMGRVPPPEDGRCRTLSLGITTPNTLEQLRPVDAGCGRRMAGAADYPSTC